MPLINHIGTAAVLLAGAALAWSADFNVGNSGSTSYLINGAADPALTLVRGRTYTFAIAATGHPFWIKTSAVTGTGSAYASGVSGNGTQAGTLTFAVPLGAPDTLFYICQFHAAMQGTSRITNPPPTQALLNNPRRTGPAEFRFDVAGTPGRQHVVEARALESGGWQPVITNVPASGNFTFADTNAVLPGRLYRVLTR